MINFKSIIALLYIAYYIYGMEGFLDTIGEYMEVHSTFKGDVSKIPNHIVNHGECVIIMLIPCNYYPSPVMVTHIGVLPQPDLR